MCNLLTTSAPVLWSSLVYCKFIPLSKDHYKRTDTFFDFNFQLRITSQKNHCFYTTFTSDHDKNPENAYSGFEKQTMDPIINNAN